MRVYKGFNKKIQAKHGKGTFQYEKGKTYKEEKSKTRSTGFHTRGRLVMNGILMELIFAMLNRIQSASTQD
jgi:hypothetical protein